MLKNRRLITKKNYKLRLLTILFSGNLARLWNMVAEYFENSIDLLDKGSPRSLFNGL
jgi:hypothetical protein